MEAKPTTVKAISAEEFYTAHGRPLGLKLEAGQAGLHRKIREATVNRPGLALAGFFRYFAWARVQVLGNAEKTYLKSLSSAERRDRIRAFFQRRVPCVVFSRNIAPSREFLEEADALRVPLFRSPLLTGRLINSATLMLDMDFAPKMTEHGTMVDILGIGVLIKGESGVGKSECALALLERGYSLVSDDVTRIQVLDGRELMATSPDETRYLMEVRGLGLIDVSRVFGVGAIRSEKRIDLVVTLQDAQKMESIERVGMEQEFLEILGIAVPHVCIPVSSGRDLARLVEVAALDQKLKSMGYNTAMEFNNRLIARMSKEAKG
ncbi:MAG: HPr(Ser) kinase/phosphatase [Verrucomicrobia bacterium]|nr:HPr(Ser) kinase/phosphatase [Verrucomicrobiota bacterium]